MNVRGDVRRMLLHRGWEPGGRSRRALVKGRALWTPVNDCGDSGIDGRKSDGRRWSVSFATDVPARVIVAACEAAA